jgi:hypothetical protein
MSALTKITPRHSEVLRNIGMLSKSSLSTTDASIRMVDLKRHMNGMNGNAINGAVKLLAERGLVEVRDTYWIHPTYPAGHTAIELLEAEIYGGPV